MPRLCRLIPVARRPVAPERLPLSTSALLTHSRSVCGEQPILAAIDDSAAQREA